jgi:hypothetical protein
LTTKGEQELDRTIAKCIDTVMDEQENQWDTDDDDWGRLAAATERVTRENVAQALEIAKQDEVDAKLAWDEEEEQTLGENNSNKEEESPTSKTRTKKKRSSRTDSKQSITSRTNKSDRKDPPGRNGSRSSKTRKELFSKLSKNAMFKNTPNLRSVAFIVEKALIDVAVNV